jgi:hypothetical protein
MRTHPRVDFETEVELVLDYARVQGRTVNISVGGVFLAGSMAPEVGSKVTLLIRLPGVPDICSIPCVVRWSKIDEGVGLHFESLRPIEVWSISRIMRAAEPSVV